MQTIDLMAPVRNAVASNIQAAFGADTLPGIQYTDPPGDPGLFGPDSVTWKVHGHPSGIIGGFSSLMLQNLHPLPMAGVTDHSDYQSDPFGRLSRTASFVAATTYASTEVADAVIDHVNHVHTFIHGTAPDGRYYSAQDPELLRWVHVAEMVSILNAHRRYHPNPIRGADLDRYFDETAIVVEKLGSNNIPRSRDEVRQYLRDIRPELECGDQAKVAMKFLMTPIGPDPVSRGISSLLIQAAIDLLPSWAQQLHGIHRPPGFDALTVRPAAFSLIQTLAFFAGPSPIRAQAEARAAAKPVTPAARPKATRARSTRLTSTKPGKAATKATRPRKTATKATRPGKAAPKAASPDRRAGKTPAGKRRTTA